MTRITKEQNMRGVRKECIPLWVLADGQKLEVFDLAQFRRDHPQLVAFDVDGRQTLHEPQLAKARELVVAEVNRVQVFQLEQRQLIAQALNAVVGGHQGLEFGATEQQGARQR